METCSPRSVDLSTATANLFRMLKCSTSLANARKDLREAIERKGVDNVDLFWLFRVREARTWRREVLSWLAYDARQIALDHGQKMIEEFNQRLNRYQKH